MNLSIKCNVCSGQSFKVIEEKYHPYKVLKCLNCGLVFVEPQPQNITQHYSDNYFQPWISPEIRKSREKFFQRRWKKVKSFFKNQKGKLLDIGCGCGEFLYFAKKDGWEVYGTEISYFSLDYVSKTYGINIFIGNFEELPYSENFFDLITMWHVLEHLPDTKKTLTKISKIIKKDGLLVIAIPNVRSYIYNFLYRTIKGKPLEIFNPDMRELHLYHFDQFSIRRLLTETGFNIVKETVDLGTPNFLIKFLNIFALTIFKFTGLNYGTAIEIFAVKR